MSGRAEDRTLQTILLLIFELVRRWRVEVVAEPILLGPPDETGLEYLLNQLEPWHVSRHWSGPPHCGTAWNPRRPVTRQRPQPVDLTKLRRDVHEVLHVEHRRRDLAWGATSARHRRAPRDRDSMPPARRMPAMLRSASAIRGELSACAAMLVCGESGWEGRRLGSANSHRQTAVQQPAPLRRLRRSAL